MHQDKEKTASQHQRILHLTWPTLIGQIAVIAYGVADTMMTARYSAADLAALAVGSSIYISIFLGLSGILQALTPQIAHAFGAREGEKIGHLAHQGIWLALALALLGAIALCFPYPLLALAKAGPEMQAKVLQYLRTLAPALPATLAFVVYSAINNGSAQPRMVMVLQVFGLLLKIVLNAGFIYGMAGLPALGGPGCALATMIVAWVNLALAWWLLKQKRAYRSYRLFGRAWEKPHWPTLRSLLALGLPIGASYFIEVSSFTFMAIFISRLGESAVGAHQIMANIGAIIFMWPLSVAHATSTLVAQARGAGMLPQALAITRHGLQLGIGGAFIFGLACWLLRDSLLGLYTHDPQVVQRALPLFLFLAAYQIFDATQCIIAFVLRAWNVVFWPMLANAFALWGMGLLVGCILGLNLLDLSLSPAISGVQGFWLANSLSLVWLALLLYPYLRFIEKRAMRADGNSNHLAAVEAR
ncbi:MATE family efflux transporter [Massilia sp. W12]|uniref:MATE family efflux transporter n=1 Tax=Massilia sp. W12 TaxID=3126507 RepID=UPI0030D470D0